MSGLRITLNEFFLGCSSITLYLPLYHSHRQFITQRSKRFLVITNSWETLSIRIFYITFIIIERIPFTASSVRSFSFVFSLFTFTLSALFLFHCHFTLPFFLPKLLTMNSLSMLSLLILLWNLNCNNGIHFIQGHIEGQGVCCIGRRSPR